MTKMEKIAELLEAAGVTDYQALLEDAEAEIRTDAVGDVKVELKDWMSEAPASEKAGYRAAIQVITSNF